MSTNHSQGTPLQRSHSQGGTPSETTPGTDSAALIRAIGEARAAGDDARLAEALALLKGSAPGGNPLSEAKAAVASARQTILNAFDHNSIREERIDHLMGLGGNTQEAKELVAVGEILPLNNVNDEASLEESLQSFDGSKQRDASKDVLETIRIDEIAVDEKFNVRGKIDKDSPEILELAKSIELQGLLEPIIVWMCEINLGEYAPFLVAGFRRLTACKLLGWKNVSCVVLPLETQLIDAEFINLTENVARKDLEAWQIAEKCYYFKTEHKMHIKEICQRIARSEQYIYALLRLHTCLHPKLLAIFRGDQAGEQTTTYQDLLRLTTIKDLEEQYECWEKLQGKKALFLEGKSKSGRKSSDDFVVRRVSNGKLKKLLHQIDNIQRVHGIHGEVAHCEKMIIRKTIRYVMGIDPKCPFVIRKK